jgi:fatty-acyl-CoA synthase
MSESKKLKTSHSRPSLAKALEMIWQLDQSSCKSLPSLINSLAGQFASAPALIDESQVINFRGLDRLVNQVARWGLRQGLEAGDVVCLLMQNCAQYPAIWMGLSRVGVITALINTNLKLDALAFAINSARPKHVVVGDDLADDLIRVQPALGSNVQSWVVKGASSDLRPLVPELAVEADEPLSAAEDRAPQLTDCALYIYTSGTTGLPKPARISHFRLLQWSYWFAGLMDVSSDDRMFNCLPMYHSVGGVVAVGALLVKGGSVVVRPRFSARNFWHDLVESDCTLFQYIGELCRYLLNTPYDSHESRHRVRLCCGNGLRADVWAPFQKRFQIPHILEFYASTEGNVSLYNCDGKVGAIGRWPSHLARWSNLALVKLDRDSGQPIRTREGFCIRCDTGEVGEAIGRITDSGSGTNRFEGYVDPKATAKKILSDVFAQGDRWFRTGDLMRQDSGGYYYFVDRIGDTFRWKGENVSTIEVANTVAAFAGVSEAVVYGVMVPGAEGKAGMAAIVADPELDLTSFHQFLIDKLPEYARPLFVRVCDRLETTATFKSTTTALVAEGYDPERISDRLFFRDPSSVTFVPLTPDLHGRIRQGDVRL